MTITAYADLVATARRAGYSDRPRPTVFVIHRVDCRRKGSKAEPLEHWKSVPPETLLRRARHSLNAKGCGYCNPDLSPRE